MGDHQPALSIYMDVLEWERRVLGNEHPNAPTDVGNCAETLCQLGDHAAAAAAIPGGCRAGRGGCAGRRERGRVPLEGGAGQIA